MSIEGMLIGEQAKKFREAAGITLEEMQEHNQAVTLDFKAFENGEIYSSEIINELQQLYNQTIENLYIEKRKSFLAFLERYSQENELDSESLIDTYYHSIAENIVNHEDKKRSIDIVKKLMINTNRSIENYYSSQNNVKQLKSMFNELLDFTKNTIQNNKEINEDCNAYMETADVLTRIVAASEHKDRIIKEIKEEMEICRADDFPEYEEDIYIDLIEELKTYWDFLEEVK